MLGSVSTPISFLGRLDTLAGANVQFASTGTNTIRTATMDNGSAIGSGTEIRFSPYVSGTAQGTTGLVTVLGGAASTVTLNGKVYGGTQSGEQSLIRSASLAVANRSTLNFTGLQRGNFSYTNLNVNFVGGAQSTPGFSPGSFILVASSGTSPTFIAVEIPAGARPTAHTYSTPDVASVSVAQFGNYSNFLAVGYRGQTDNIPNPSVMTVPANATFRMENRINNFYTQAQVGDSFTIISTSPAGLPSFTDDQVYDYVNGTIQYAGGLPTVSSFQWQGTPPTLPADGFWAVQADSSVLRLYVAPIPEPTTILGIAAGVLGLGHWIRRRKAKKIA